MTARIAFRNVFRNRRRSAITLLVIVFGAVGLILFGGYKQQTFRALRESTIRSRLGHLQIYKRGFASNESKKPLEYGLDDVAALRRAVESDRRVKMTAAQITLMGLVSNGDKSETFIATAVEPLKEKQMNGYRLVGGSDLPANETDAVLVGRGLATAMRVKPGDYLTLMTTTTTGSLNATDVRVAGIFMSGVKEFDDRAVKMPIAGAQQLLQTKKVERLIVTLNDTDDTAAVRADLGRTLPQIEMKSWSELATFYHQVVLLYNGIFGFLGLIVSAIVVFSVANTILMSIFERTREIGTLMAMGTTRSRVARMFLAEGVVIGVLGAIAGVVGGVILANLINRGHFMLPPPPGYTVGYPLRMLLTPSILVTAAFISVVTATISSIVPALKASRMKVVDALGHI
ncbi:MAG TPA: FtsX-like permease family protein [Thermoanaerobaculia bacterium]|jgi:putative ABC transport system permease protein